MPRTARFPDARSPNLCITISAPMSKYFRSLSISALVVFCFLTTSAQTAPYDLIIRNGHIIDDTGSPGTRALSAFAPAADDRKSEINRLN
jgi:hypothetical protein